jgi:phosphoribosylamine--glycine ligase
MGTVIRYVRKSKLADLMLKPLTERLHEVGYVGDIDMNCMIEKANGKAWPLELTMRPGWPSWHIQGALHVGDPADWMVNLVHGWDTLEVEENAVCVGVVLALPDFPFDKQIKKVVGQPIYGMDDLGQHHPSEMMIGARPSMLDGKDERGWVAAGTYLAVTTGKGKTVNGARRSAYSAVEKIKAPRSPFYRPDIGEKLRDQLPILQEHGFAKDMTY